MFDTDGNSQVDKTEFLTVCQVILILNIYQRLGFHQANSKFS